MAEIKLPEPLRCLRCDHRWTPRKRDVRRCPACFSPYWDQPRGKQQEEEAERKVAGNK